MARSSSAILCLKGQFQKQLVQGRYPSAYNTKLVENCPPTLLLVTSKQGSKLRNTNLYSSQIHHQSIAQDNENSVSETQKKTTGVENLQYSQTSSLMKYKCPHCDFLHAEKESVKRHVISVHKLKPFSCPHCNEGFTNIKIMNKHIQQIHPQEKRVKEPYVQVSATDKQSSISKKQVTETPKFKSERVLTETLDKEKIENNLNESSKMNKSTSSPIKLKKEKVPFAEESKTKKLKSVIEKNNVSNLSSGSTKKSFENLPNVDILPATIHSYSLDELKAIVIKKPPKLMASLYPMKSAELLGPLDDRYLARPYKNLKSTLVAKKDDQAPLNFVNDEEINSGLPNNYESKSFVPTKACEKSNNVNETPAGLGGKLNEEVVVNSRTVVNANMTNQNIANEKTLEKSDLLEVSGQSKSPADNVKLSDDAKSIGQKIRSYAITFLQNLHSGFDGLGKSTKK